MEIDHQFLSIEQLWEQVHREGALRLSAEARDAVAVSRAYLEGKVQEDRQYYGINTGFGSLCNVKIARDELSRLQENLVRSHATGMGEVLSPELVRLMLFLKIRNMSFGYSGVREELIDRLVAVYNAGILPVVYELGSLGASGDLAPLAHLSLVLLGEGEVWYRGQRMPSRAALDQAGIAPLELREKEGLALLNGTQFSSAHAVWCQWHGERLSRLADMVAALSLDAYNGKLAAFSPWVTRIRPHAGAVRSSETVRRWLSDSELADRESEDVQDPYSFRCVPQVHGASADVLEHTRRVIETEINAVTDNPVIVSSEDLIISGGNFHAQPLALALDYMAMALSEYGNISERRSYQLINGARGLPAYLTRYAGLNSGYMITQYTAASIVSQNKQLCTPASVDSIVSSRGQEDHVSMAANAATKAVRVVRNVYRILAIEWMTAAQAMEFRRPSRTGTALESLLAQYRELVPPLEEDRILYEDMDKTVHFLENLELPELGDEI